MLRFYADRFHDATNLMAALRPLLQNQEGKYLKPTECLKYLKILEPLSQMLAEMNLLVSKKSIDYLIERLKIQPCQVDHALNSVLGCSFRTINDELELVLLFSVKPQNAKYYDPIEPLFGKAVADQFPSEVATEIDEAGRCFALARYTGCVFHLMRILESGIDAARKCLGIPDPVKDAERNWAAILRKINDEKNRRSTTKPMAWKQCSDKEFFEEVYVSLDSVRNVWRNATMHVGKTYSEEQAEHIFNAVRGFMRKLAERVDEQGHPSA